MEVNKKYKIFIAEDMAPARKRVRKLAAARLELEPADAAKNGEEAMRMLLSKNYDLLLLDIQLPVISGIEIVERLEQVPYVIFITAYDRYAVKAFELGAIDYLLKPFSVERFNQAIDRFLDTKTTSRNPQLPLHNYSLTFKEKRIQFVLPFTDIIYISSSGKQNIIHTEKKDFQTSGMIKHIEVKLPPGIFVRVHKQFIVNIHFVVSIKHDVGGQYIAIIKDSDESVVPVGRTFLDRLKEK
ncbi:MAG: response regulator transcription factor, partial [bacterium]|nr:response regulator transcription factor [bacterium]